LGKIKIPSIGSDIVLWRPPGRGKKRDILYWEKTLSGEGLVGGKERNKFSRSDCDGLKKP